MDVAAARANVTRALHDAIDAGEGFEDGEFVATWVAVVHLTSVTDPTTSAYYLMSPETDGSPPHVIRGLLQEGLASPLLDGERRED